MEEDGSGCCSLPLGSLVIESGYTSVEMSQCYP